MSNQNQKPLYWFTSRTNGLRREKYARAHRISTLPLFMAWMWLSECGYKTKELGASDLFGLHENARSHSQDCPLRKETHNPLATNFTVFLLQRWTSDRKTEMFLDEANVHLLCSAWINVMDIFPGGFLSISAFISGPSLSPERHKIF